MRRRSAGTGKGERGRGGGGVEMNGHYRFRSLDLCCLRRSIGKDRNPTRQGRERDTPRWVFTPSQPGRLYQGEGCVCVEGGGGGGRGAGGTHPLSYTVILTWCRMGSSCLMLYRRKYTGRKGNRVGDGEGGEGEGERISLKLCWHRYMGERGSSSLKLHCHTDMR